MATHLAQGNRAVFVADGYLVAAQGGEQRQLPLSGVPISHHGSIGFQVENVMAAVGAAWALGLDWDTITHGLATFSNDTDNALGRFNLFSYRGATVIADYGHNPDAILALVRAVENMPGKRRSVVISGAGDRRDSDIIEQTQILGEAFDEVVLYQDQCQRGRADGEVLALLRSGLSDARRTRVIHEIQGEFLAIDTAMDQLSAGDLCLILVDQVDEALAHISARVQKA
jgi:cyanophycin synthetase